MLFRKRNTTADQKPVMARRNKPTSLTSISSNDSFSTAPSSAPRTPASPSRHSRSVEFDPLSLHPTHLAPPRLADRAFIDLGSKVAASPRIRGLDPEASPAQEEFSLRLDLLERPALVRSRWSESTISTVFSDTSEEEVSEEDESPEDVAPEGPEAPELQIHTDEREVCPAWQNFSLKRNTVAVPRRRPAGNPVDDYVKRGCWKRRGIVFQSGDENFVERMSAQTVG